MKIWDMLDRATSRAGVIGVRGTALDPFLWLIGLSVPISLVLAVVAGIYGLPPYLVVSLLVFAFAPMLLTMIYGGLLLIRDPDRLQSEEYRLTQRHITYLEGKSIEHERVMLPTPDPAEDDNNTISGYEGEKR